MLRLRTLGGLAVEADVGPLTGAATQRKPLGLLALLAAAGTRGVPRDQVLLYFWPDSTPDRGRNVLKQTLYALRRDLHTPDLLLGEVELRLNPAVIGSDLAEFEAAIAGGDPARAVELYRGPFLEGFELRDAPEFERWRETERRRLSRRYGEAVEALAADAGRSGDPARVVELWRRFAASDPEEPQAALGLMAALAAAGDPEAALRHARIYQQLLEQSGGRLPQEVAALADRIRTIQSDAEAAVPEPPAEPRANGRTSDRRALTRWLPLLAVLLTMVLAGLARYGQGEYARRHLDPDRLVVAPYQVLDPELELWKEGLVDVLSRNLDGAGPIRTVSPSFSLQRWQGHPDPGSAVELARSTGAGLALVGALLRSGRDSVRVTSTLVDGSTGNVVAEVEWRDHVDRMDRLTDSLTIRVLHELERHRGAGLAPSVTLAATTSLVALKAFLRGEQFYRRARWDSAGVFYQRAVAHDSGFALALRGIGNVLAWQRLTVDSLTSAYLLRAGQHNRSLNAHDSLLVAADSLLAAVNLTEDDTERWRLTRRLFATLDEATRRYPESPAAWLALAEAGYHYGTGPGIGVPEPEVLAAFDSAIALDPTFAPSWIHTVELGFNVHGREVGLGNARRYLALKPQEPARQGIELVVALLEPGADTARQRMLLQRVPADPLVSARTILRRWPDEQETAVLLSRLLAAGRPSRYPLFSDTSFMRRRLAQQLAFRGHFREAAGVLGVRETPIFFELAYLGAVRPEAAAPPLKRWMRERSEYARLGLPLWHLWQDTAAIQAFRRAAPAALYDTAAASAYLLLSRGDSAAALRRFRTLPDTLCPFCYLDRLTLARLQAAAEQLPEALATLREPLDAFLTPIEVVFALERGRIAERAGARSTAYGAYRLVARAWANADRELMDDVELARQGLERTAR